MLTKLIKVYTTDGFNMKTYLHSTVFELQGIFSNNNFYVLQCFFTMIKNMIISEKYLSLVFNVYCLPLRDQRRMPFLMGWKYFWHLLLLLLLILYNSPWGLSELWVGGVPTSYIDHSGPSICCLLLRTLINPPWTLLIPSYVPSYLSYSPSCLCTWSSAYQHLLYPLFLNLTYFCSKH